MKISLRTVNWSFLEKKVEKSLIFKAVQNEKLHFMKSLEKIFFFLKIKNKKSPTSKSQRDSYLYEYVLAYMCVHVIWLH